jgi:hypothetical protein
MKLEFSRQIFEKSSNIKFLQILPIGVQLHHAEGRTDMKVIVAFRSFANALKKYMCLAVMLEINYTQMEYTSRMWRHSEVLIWFCNVRLPGY